jgi:hypothetical protein
MIYRVSQVEQFRQYETDDEMDAAALIERLQWGGTASPAMLAGTALHKALELASYGEFVKLEALGHRFLFPESLALELPTIRELRASRAYVVDGEPITISGQVDAIDGRTVYDHKSTGRFDPDRYLTGAQWRLYLDIFGADRFVWNVLEVQEAAGIEGDPTIVYDVKAAHRLEQWRYPGLEADCQALVERFARFARDYIEAGATA